MPDSREIRKHNAQQLLEELWHDNMSEMAREMSKYHAGTVAPSTVRRWFYTGEDARSIGNNMARLIERTAGKPVGWLDVTTGDGQRWEEEAFSKVPILNLDVTPSTRMPGWFEYGSISERTGNAVDGHVNVPQTNPEVYASEINTDIFSPTIRPGWIVVADPLGQPKPGDLIGIKLKSGPGTVREFLWHNPPRFTVARLNSGEREYINDEDIERISVITHIIPPSQRLS